jgi:hypothetical protein
MDLKGQRFELDLSDDEDERASTSRIPTGSLPSLPFVSDVQERVTAPPSAPTLKKTPTGFPEHKTRTRISAFKQQRSQAVSDPVSKPAGLNKPSTGDPRPFRRTSSGRNDQSFEDEERRRIDEDNKQRLAAMSTTEIDEERQELLAGLNPSLIERLLKRANLDEGRGDTGIDLPTPKPDDVEETKEQTEVEVQVTSAPRPTGRLIENLKSVRFREDEQDLENESNGIISGTGNEQQPEVHFPSAPPVADLDPSDPSFLENLHNKYFPDLPNDPSKLAWMAPIPTHGSVADQESPYYPAHEALPASALRFDFRGGLLPPRISRAMPITKGLHHHGEAPEAAGYTVPELARLSRSTYPAQRCIAYQTLGRFLYRLGRGEWGDEDSEITKGLWRCVEEGKIVQTLEEAASADGGHQGSKVYAVEAAWLWHKGGGKRWKAN